MSYLENCWTRIITSITCVDYQLIVVTCSVTTVSTRMECRAVLYVLKIQISTTFNIQLQEERFFNLQTQQSSKGIRQCTIGSCTCRGRKSLKNHSRGIIKMREMRGEVGKKNFLLSGSKLLVEKSRHSNHKFIINLDMFNFKPTDIRTSL